MPLIIGLFAVFAILLGLAGLARPSVLVSFGRRFADGPGVWGGFAIRGVLALALWLTAPESRTPDTLRVLAVLFAIGAIALPLMGARRFEAMVERSSAGPPMALRAWSLLGLALGGFLLWSVFG